MAHLGAGTTTPIDFGISPVLTAACPTTAGAGETNVGALYLDAPSVVLFTSGPTFRIAHDVAGSANLTSKCLVRGYAAVALRDPTGVTSVGGTMSTPVFA